MNLYDILGVQRDADAATIKKAYRSKAQFMHPNKGGDEVDFKALQNAYEVLSDPERRKRYDETGAETVEKTLEEEAAEGLAHMFLDAFMGQRDPVTFLREKLTKEEAVMHKKRKRLNKQAEKIEKRAGKLTFSGKGKNWLQEALELKAVGLRSEAAKEELFLTQIAEAKRLLQDYSMQDDPDWQEPERPRQDPLEQLLTVLKMGG